MSGYIGSFERIELKYMVPAEKYDELIRRISEFAEVDSYGDTTIYNIYFDTEDDRLIRKSLEKPAYKEKLRLRTYEVPSNESPSFVEIKKKFDGVVYKRRISLPYEESITHLVSGKSFSSDSKSFTDCQIAKEINSMISLYGKLVPKMMIAYDRVAFIGKEDSSLRITFDKNIRWRKSDLSLKSGGYGKKLLREGDRLMEIKIAGAMPMNLARILSGMKIFKTSFSKYGNAYVENLLNEKARNIIVMNERQQSLVLGRKEEVAYA